MTISCREAVVRRQQHRCSQLGKVALFSVVRIRALRDQTSRELRSGVASTFSEIRRICGPLPIIAVSSAARVKDIVAAMKTGVTHFLQKPPTDVSLESAIEFTLVRRVLPGKRRRLASVSCLKREAKSRVFAKCFAGLQMGLWFSMEPQNQFIC